MKPMTGKSRLQSESKKVSELLAAPTAPVGQAEKYDFNKVRSRHFDDTANDYSDLCLHRVDQNECTICNPAAPAANALPETDDKISDQRLKELTEAFDDIGTEDLMLDTCANTDGFEIADALRQLAAAQREIAELKGYQLNYEHATKLERQDHAEELKQARRDVIEEAVEILGTEGWLGESMQRIRALMEKPE